jgi:hypothetical protein
MKFLVSSEEFEAMRECLDDLASIDGPFSRGALAKSLVSFRLMSFASIFRRDFFCAVKALSKSDDEGSFSLLVLDPDPVRYSREFGRYNAVVFDEFDGAQNYIAAINDGPKGSSADSIVDSSNRLVFFSASRKWLLVGDRETNLTYCCFVDRDTRTKFEQFYSGEFFPNTASAETFSLETTGQVAFLSNFNS